MPIPQLKQETFFLMAWILMGVSVIGNVISLSMNWATSNIGNRISSISMMLFNLLLMVLFLSMWIGQTKTKVKDSPELEAYLQTLEKEVDNGKN